jgi:sugar/nucleoside kinase (ribokinase family)
MSDEGLTEGARHHKMSASQTLRARCCRTEGNRQWVQVLIPTVKDRPEGARRDDRLCASLSFIMPRNGKRAIVRCRDDDYRGSFPILDLTGCHVDGHQADAPIRYARRCRGVGILTSLDGGGLRSNTHDLLAFMEVAVVAERLSEQMALAPSEMLTYLKTRACRVGGVTLGEWGLLWYDEAGTVRSLGALSLAPRCVIDTSGAGDVFHGAYVYSRLARPEMTWEEHFRFASAARPTRSNTLETKPACPH